MLLYSSAVPREYREITLQNSRNTGISTYFQARNGVQHARKLFKKFGSAQWGIKLLKLLVGEESTKVCHSDSDDEQTDESF